MIFKFIWEKKMIKNYVIKFLSPFILFRLKLRFYLARKNNNSAIVFISIPTHGNLGDQAIVYSQLRFFKDLELSSRLVLITYREFQRHFSFIKKTINLNDLIIIDGGGNMGSLWYEHGEKKIQSIIQEFISNHIIIFPQTVYYSDDNNDKILLEESKKVYNSNKNLVICARDKKSFDLINHLYEVPRKLLVPDIVLYNNNLARNQKRKFISICLRLDREKNVDLPDLFSDFKLNFPKENIKEISTLINKKITNFNRKFYLKRIWRKFSLSKVVVTDRLHGMIFSAVTSTPCIALDNLSGKVFGSFFWLKELPYIQFVHDTKGIITSLKYLISQPKNQYNNEHLLESFNVLKSVIYEILNGVKND